ncbi:MAG TPA: PIG-L family deacetylase [Clostridiales bacterium]|nr:PIG-L family deacetylase [Clostridiales bacterium]
MQNKQLRILTIGAHPDDCELTTGGICTKYKRQGHVVKYVYTTNGNAGHHKMAGEKLAEVRAEEIRNACAIAGFEYEIMNNDDGYLESSVCNRDNLIRIIRKFQPDIVFTHRPNDYHPDHRHTAILLQDASFLIRVPLICPDTPALSYSPVIMYMADSFKKPMPFEPCVVVSIDDAIETKIKILDCHKSQFYEWLPWLDGYTEEIPASGRERIEWLTSSQISRDNEIAERFRSELVKRYGKEKGLKIKCAEAFELSEYGRELKRDEIQAYFPF